jgi:rubrerythrin
MRRWRRRLADEREEAKVYRHLAQRRTGEEREVLLGLAEAEGRHAEHWARLLGDDIGRGRQGVADPEALLGSGDTQCD